MNTINLQKYDVNEEEREITFSCASEAPYQRYDDDLQMFFDQILIIRKDAVNLDRLNNFAPLLFNHDPNKLLGTVIRAWIDNDKIFVRVKFSKNDAFADRIYKDIIDGVIRNVSIGYQIEEYQETTEDNKVKRYITRWSIYECSIVSIPADQTVGIRTFKNLNIKEINNMDKENKACGEMPQEEIKAEDVISQAEIEELIKENEALKAENDALKAEKEDVKEDVKEDAEQPEVDKETIEDIEKIGEDFGVDKEEIERAIENKLTVRQFKQNVKNLIIKNKETNTMKSEFADYLKTRDFSKPFVMRDFTGFSSSALVKTDKLPLVDILEKRIALKGYRTISGIRGNLSVPVQTGRNTVYTPGINEASTDSNPVFTDKTLSAVKFCASTTIGKEMIDLANDDVEAFIVDSITRELAYKAQDYMLSKVTAGAGNTVTYNALSNITWDTMLDFEKAIAGFNLENVSFVMSPAARATLKGILKSQNTAARYICEDNEINGYPVAVSGCVANDNIFFGDWNQLLQALFGQGLEFIIDPYSESRSNSVVVTGSLLMDCAVLNAGAFVVGKVQSSSSSAESSQE